MSIERVNGSALRMERCGREAEAPAYKDLPDRIALYGINLSWDGRYFAPVTRASAHILKRRYRQHRQASLYTRLSIDSLRRDNSETVCILLQLLSVTKNKKEQFRTLFLLQKSVCNVIPDSK